MSESTKPLEIEMKVGIEFQNREMRAILDRLKRWATNGDAPPEDDFDAGYDKAREVVDGILKDYQAGEPAAQCGKGE